MSGGKRFAAFSLAAIMGGQTGLSRRQASSAPAPGNQQTPAGALRAQSIFASPLRGANLDSPVYPLGSAPVG